MPQSATAVTWDPAHTDASITLSGGNLVAAISSGTGNFLSRATTGVAASSKVYWEIANNNDPDGGANDFGLGISDGSFTCPQNNFLGFDTHGWGYYSSNQVFENGSSAATWAAYFATNVVSFAVDTVNGKFWARVAGGNWNNDVAANPATNTNGLAFTLTAPVYPTLCFRDSPITALTKATAQFASASWSFTAPAGFAHL